MWTIILQFVWKILKDPRLLAIVILSFLLTGSSIKGYWYKQKVEKLEQKVDALNVEIENLKDINAKITQNRDALVKKIENLKEIDAKYKSLQARINALKKECDKKVESVVAKPTQPSIAMTTPFTERPLAKPEALGVTVLPKDESITSAVKPVPPQPDKVKPEDIIKGDTEAPVKEYQFGGYEYEANAMSIYNDLVLWFNSNDSNRLWPKSDTSSVPNPYLSATDKTSFKTIGYEQDVCSSR